jgi:hypothetical protein
VIGMSEGIRKLCLAYDVEAYSGRGTRQEYAAQERLARLLEVTFREIGLAAGDVTIQEQGDGGIAFLPTGGTVDEPRLITDLIRVLGVGLDELNEDIAAPARIRLRAALHEGVTHRAPHGYVGPAVIEACRLRDADQVRAALAQSPALLVMAIADSLYRDVLSHGYHGLPGSAFRRVEVTSKNFSGPAWIYLPAVGPAGQARPSPAAEPPAPAPGRSALEGFLGTGMDQW